MLNFFNSLADFFSEMIAFFSIVFNGFFNSGGLFFLDFLS